MKKMIIAITVAVIFATFFSLGLECCLNLFGMSMAIALDGSSVTKQYPRFIPFLLIVGIFALVSLIGIFILNLKVSVKKEFTKKIWWIQIIIAVAISIPMIKSWETLFDFLQKTL